MGDNSNGNGGSSSNNSCFNIDPNNLLLDYIDGGSIEKVIELNTLESYDELKAKGWPKDNIQLLCKNCLAAKYGVSRETFDVCDI